MALRYRDTKIIRTENPEMAGLNIVSATITIFTILNLRLYYADEENEVGTFWRIFAKLIRCKCRQSKKNAKSDRYIHRQHNRDIIGGLNQAREEDKGDDKVNNRTFTGNSGNRPYIVHSAGFILNKHDHNTENAEEFRKRDEEHLEDTDMAPKTTWKEISVALDPWLFFLFLVEFNEVEERISYNGILYLAWTDELMTWNTSEYGDLNDFFIEIQE
ncbi:hypothetical protein MAR_013073 [Mya arenaria]|uniref:Uncharacterized protein n=1 Tax=Mya arenaria TaxID=6604 RepID=A0ABY7G1V2_MYAAR|nr:hypothetical protein MAR_013073 [Mya arenaria]